MRTAAAATAVLTWAASAHVPAQHAREGEALARLDALLSTLEATNATMPQQLHLSLTGSPTEMRLTYVTMDTACVGKVSYTGGGGHALPDRTTYTAGDGWKGSIWSAVLTGLTPGSSCTYTACCDGACAGAATFKQPPVPGPSTSIRIAVTADMGTVELFGFLVADEIVKEHVAEPFDLVVLAGDVSYATVDPPRNEIELFWDAFGVQAEGWAATAPFMLTVGNHEHVPGTVTDAAGVSSPADYASFQARYIMPGPATGGNLSFWFSYVQGPVHFISLSSEHPSDPGSPQTVWLEAALGGVNKSVTPWTVVLLHRPLLSACTDEEGDHVPGNARLAAWEPHFKAYGVDVVIQGHQHLYERVHPNWNGVVAALPSGPDNTYTNPGAPVYIVAATSGAVIGGGWQSPIPAWSAVQIAGPYGFGRMKVDGAAGTLAYTFVDTDGKVHDTWGIVKTGA